MDEQQPQWKPTLGLGIAVAALLFLGWGILNPGFVNGDRGAHLNTIANNLRILEGAKEQYALENKLPTTATVDMNTLTPYLKNQQAVVPVVTETYVFATVGDLVQATGAGTLAGKSFPFTVTSF